MVALYKFLQAEVILKNEVILEIRGRNLVPMKNQCLRSHQLHESLTEMSDYPLLDKCNNKTTL